MDNLENLPRFRLRAGPRAARPRGPARVRVPAAVAAPDSGGSAPAFSPARAASSDNAAKPATAASGTPPPGTRHCSNGPEDATLQTSAHNPSADTAGPQAGGRRHTRSRRIPSPPLDRPLRSADSAAGPREVMLPTDQVPGRSCSLLPGALFKLLARCRNPSAAALLALRPVYTGTRPSEPPQPRDPEPRPPPPLRRLASPAPPDWHRS